MSDTTSTEDLTAEQHDLTTDAARPAGPDQTQHADAALADPSRRGTTPSRLARCGRG